MNKDAKMGDEIKSGEVTVKKPFTVKAFSEDDGWFPINIKPGTYEYRVFNVRGWRPRQIMYKGYWVDVGDECEELEEIISSLEETTTVANIAPTVDYTGHVKPVDLLKGDDSYESDYDKPDDDTRIEKDKDDPDWVSPIGRLLAGESVRSVIGKQFGLKEEKKTPENLELFKKISKVKDIMNYPGKLVVATAYPHRGVFGIRIEDPEITKFYGGVKNSEMPYVIVDITPATTEKMDELDNVFYEFTKSPAGFRDYLNGLAKSPEIKDIYVHQKEKTK